MYKYTALPEETPHGEATMRVVAGSSVEGRTKLAFKASTNDPRVRSFVDSLAPKPNCLYVLVNALGAGDYYGPNVNADFFQESQLNPVDGTTRWGHRTFLTAGVFRNHRNKDRTKSFGSVVYAVYNQLMRRVELILCVDQKRCIEFGHGDLYERLDRGVAVPVSMGCRVPFDVCRIRGCGNKARTAFDYCSHMKQRRNRILDDGQQVCVNNPRPVFFDISFVVVNADAVGYTMLKIASAASELPALSAEETFLDAQPEKVADDKTAELVKRIPAMASKLGPALESCRKGIPEESLRGMFPRGRNFGTVLRSLTGMGAVLSPQEFGAGLMHSLGQASRARGIFRGDQVVPSGRPIASAVRFRLPAEDRGVTRGLRADHGSAIGGASLQGALLRMFAGRSLRSGPPPVSVHITISQGPPSPRMLKIGAAYDAYREDLLNYSECFLPADALDDDGSADLEKLAGAASKNFAIALPLAYLYSAYTSRKAPQQKGTVENLVESHPILAATAATGMVELAKLINKKLPHLV
jgi:hypothetical protein